MIYDNTWTGVLNPSPPPQYPHKWKHPRDIITSKEENDQNAYDFVKLMKQFVGLKELTAAMVNTLIDRITVGESELNKDGDMVQEIKIFYRFVGHID